MYCAKCGQEIKKEAKFCPRCGNPVSSFKKANSVPKKKHSKVWISLLTICLLAVVAGGYVVSRIVKEEEYLACVQNENKKYGYINKEGKEVIECKYDAADEFYSNGLALVGKQVDAIWNEESKENEPIYQWGLINKKGEEVVPYKYNDIGSFQNGMAMVEKGYDTDEDGYTEYLYGYINEKGEEIISCQYTYAGDFAENGLARVGKERGTKGIYGGYINKKGEEVIPCQYADAYDFAENGLAAVSIQDGIDEDGDAVCKWGYIDESGEEVIPCKYASARDFTENGLAVVSIEDGIDEEGCIVHKRGCIDEKGKEVFWCTYDALGDFGENGLALIGEATEDGIKWGYIDIRGEEKVPVIYNYAQEFHSNTLAMVAVESGIDEEGYSIYDYGLINSEGEEVVPCEYESISLSGTADLWYISEKNDQDESKTGLINQKGELIIPMEYDYIGYFEENDIIPVGKERKKDLAYNSIYKCQYLDKKGNVVLDLSENYIYAGRFVKIES